MRYTNVFCGRYTLATGTRVIAWFNIVLYVINIVFNILAVDIVKSYKENVDDDTHYNREQLLIFHYICLIFGVITVLSSAIFLIKMSESTGFMHFMVKWNIVRCIFAFVAIIYVCAVMDHIFTVVISSSFLVIDLCASSYFTGVMSSYIKQMEDPSGQIYSGHGSRELSVHLVSHKTTSQKENKVDYVDEVSTFPSHLPAKGNTSIQRETTGTVNIAVDVETRKHATEEMNLDSVPATNDYITRTANIAETENSSSATPNDEGGHQGNDQTTTREKIATAESTSTETETNGKSDPNNANQKDDELEERRTTTDSETTNPDNNEPHSDSDNDTRDKTDNKKSSTDINLTEETEVVPADTGIQVESEKREIQKPDNEVDSDIQGSDRNPTEDSEKSGEVKGIENPAVDVSEIEPPSVVTIPASPDMT